MIEVVTEWRRWAAVLERLGVDDCYADLRYAQIWADEECAETRPVGLHYRGEDGEACYVLLLVSLDTIGGGKGLYEARTPYDFGGPWVKASKPEATTKAFEAELSEWLQDNAVISEFARIHPFAASQSRDDAQWHADNFVIGLEGSLEQVRQKQHRRHRRAVRRAKKSGLHAKVCAQAGTETVGCFAELYTATMQRLNASPDYFFSHDTLRRICALEYTFLVSVTSDHRTESFGLFLRSAEVVFYYLGASARPVAAGANNLLFDEATKYAYLLGASALHLGGGSESLRRFKGQLATGTVPYSVVKKVVDPVAYQKLCRANCLSEHDGFPPFRKLLRERQ